jgi:Fe2+ or Zn2+ uptake regulation protein
MVSPRHGIPALARSVHRTTRTTDVTDRKRSVQTDPIQRWILEYMLEGGEDSLDGIVRWWILEQRIRDESAAVKSALNELVRRGLVMRVESRGAQTRYRLCPQMREAALQQTRRSPRAG